MTMERGSGKGRIYTGARAKLMLQGKPIGYARNVAITEELEYQPIEVLDNVEVEEHVVVAYRARFTCSMFRIVGDTLKSEGFFPPTGKNSTEHLENVLISGDLTASLYDTQTGKIIANVTGVRVASHNFTVDARGVVGEDVEFVCIAVRDESETV